MIDVVRFSFFLVVHQTKRKGISARTGIAKLGNWQLTPVVAAARRDKRRETNSALTCKPLGNGVKVKTGQLLLDLMLEICMYVR